VKHFVIRGFVAAAAMVAAANPIQAQGYNPFQIGASGGIAFPVSDLGNVTNMGYNIAVAVGLKSQYSPIGVRVEAAYNQFGFQDNVVGANGSLNIPAFTGNLVLGLPVGMLSPYAIGGVGLYRPSASINGGTSDAENDFGFNVGGGIKIPLSTSFETFVEARYHRANLRGGGNYSFVPLTVGVMF
jgi:opacity protein-like surface antigen